MKKQIVVLGVSAALLAGLATLASAAPYTRDAHRDRPTSQVSLRVTTPLIGIRIGGQHRSHWRDAHRGYYRDARRGQDHRVSREYLRARPEHGAEHHHRDHGDRQ